MSRGFALITGSVSSSGALNKLMVTALGSAFAAGVALVPNRAEALLLYTIRQVGTDVVVTGGSQGTVDLSGLNFDTGPEDNITTIAPALGQLGTGPGGAGTPTNAFSGISGPLNFGTGIAQSGFSSDAASNAVFLCANCAGQYLYLPDGYDGSTSISSTTVFSFTSFATLGLTAGTYSWTWGGGGPDQTFQLVVEVPGPLPALGAATAFGWSRRLRRRIRGGNGSLDLTVKSPLKEQTSVDG